jgi:hypothetical protein
MSRSFRQRRKALKYWRRRQKVWNILSGKNPNDTECKIIPFPTQTKEKKDEKEEQTKFYSINSQRV